MNPLAGWTREPAESSSRIPLAAIPLAFAAGVNPDQVNLGTRVLLTRTSVREAQILGVFLRLPQKAILTSPAENETI